jgi:hypothetical protein
MPITPTGGPFCTPIHTSKQTSTEHIEMFVPKADILRCSESGKNGAPEPQTGLLAERYGFLGSLYWR